LKKVIVILIVLVLIVGVTAILNRQGIEEKAASQRDAVLLIVADDFEARVDFATILELTKSLVRGSRDFCSIKGYFTPGNRNNPVGVFANKV
jgi:uncharacterized protein YceK